jgi:hypothetical protein
VSDAVTTSLERAYLLLNSDYQTVPELLKKQDFTRKTFQLSSAQLTGILVGSVSALTQVIRPATELFNELTGKAESIGLPEGVSQGQTSVEEPKSASKSESLFDKLVARFKNSDSKGKETSGITSSAFSTAAQSSGDKGAALVAPISGKNVPMPDTGTADILNNAARIANVDPSLLYAFAQQESSFNKVALAKGTGAFGLLQITPTTWKHLVGKYGKQFGVKESDSRDPVKAAVLGALYIRDIRDMLERTLGRTPSATDVYAGHFLGPTGVKTFLSAYTTNRNTIAATVLPKAAKYNPRIFYDKDGKPLTVGQVYELLYNKIEPKYNAYASRVTESSKTASASSSVPTVTEPQLADATNTINIRGAPSQPYAKPQAETQVNVPKPAITSTTTVASNDSSTISGSGIISGQPKRIQPQEYYRAPNGTLIMASA